MALVISFLVTFWVAYLIYKKYKPQPVLVVGGFILMYTAVIFGYGQILAPKASTGSILFDTFQFMSQTLSSRAAKLGLNIMCVGAFAKYMDKIGASRALVRMTIKPLLKLKSPYLVLSLSWVLGLCIGLCINSASGLAMLLMVTVFPILILEPQRYRYHPVRGTRRPGPRYLLDQLSGSHRYRRLLRSRHFVLLLTKISG